MLKFFLLVTLIPAIYMADINFRRCPNNAPVPQTLSVEGCAGNKCILIPGKSLHSVGTDIIGRINSKTATTRIIARTLGIDLGYRVPRELVNACNGSIVGGCPIVAGRSFNYSVYIDRLEVPAFNIPIEVEVNLTGDGGVPLACARFNARIGSK
ncbi:mite group 2 allergen Lep d 2-like [Armigeres subalbatus]|uniref:mite group 2 allergen Lep d 2-like n=1 Tax=Armigeres subalbatus TaxID=124917 RepID=UPI002ED03CB1